MAKAKRFFIPDLETAKAVIEALDEFLTDGTVTEDEARVCLKDLAHVLDQRETRPDGGLNVVAERECHVH